MQMYEVSPLCEFTVFNMPGQGCFFSLADDSVNVNSVLLQTILYRVRQKILVYFEAHISHSSWRKKKSKKIYGTV